MTDKDQKIVISIGILLMENIYCTNKSGMLVPESALDGYYDKALQEYIDMAVEAGQTFEGTPELRKQVIDHVRYYLERRGFLK